MTGDAAKGDAPGDLVLEYEVAWEDLEAPVRRRVSRSPAWRRGVTARRYGVSLVPPVAGLVAVSAGYMEKGGALAAGSLGAGILLFLFLPLLARWNLDRTVRTMVREETRFGSPGRRVLRVREDGVRLESPIHAMEARWGGVAALDEEGERVHLDLGPGGETAIHRAAVVRGDLDAVVTAVRHRIGDPPNPPGGSRL